MVEIAGSFFLVSFGIVLLAVANWIYSVTYTRMGFTTEYQIQINRAGTGGPPLP